MIPSQKKKNKIGAFLYQYTLTGTQFGSIGVSFRADGREQADLHAYEEASFFGKNAVAKFKKEI